MDEIETVLNELRLATAELHITNQRALKATESIQNSITNIVLLLSK